MMSQRGRRLQLPTIRLYGPGRLSHPARLFATPCNSGSDFVIPVQTRTFVQGLQRLQRPRWAKKSQEEESSYTRTCSLSPSSIHCPIATNVAGMPFVSTRQRNQGPCPPPNLYAVVNYNRICAAVKGTTEGPSSFWGFWVSCDFSCKAPRLCKSHYARQGPAPPVLMVQYPPRGRGP